MCTNSKRWWSAVFLAALILGVMSVEPATAKRSKKNGDLDLSGIVRPELINAQSDPTLRFPVMNLSGAVTYGWLDITSNTVSYLEVQPARRSNRTFSVSRFALGNLRFNGMFLVFKSPKKWQNMIYVPPSDWGKVHMAFGGLNKEANRQSLGTSSIYKTLMNFDGVLALVKPAPAPAPVIVQAAEPPPLPKPVAPPSPPAIVLSSPAGAGEGQAVELSESSVVIRGVAMDSTGIPVVRINGSPANMRPQTTRAADFWSDPLPLQVGSNHIQIIASNSAHIDAKLEVTVNYKPKAAPVNPRALDRTEIVGLLQGGVPAERIIDLIKQRGVKFSPTADDLGAIRSAGGTDDLVTAIQQAAPHP